VAPLYYSPCARLRVRLAKRRFNKLLKSPRTQLPVLCWAVGYIAISAFLAPTILRPERGELSLALIGPRGGPMANQKILRQRGVEGGADVLLLTLKNASYGVILYSSN
jgi:hypothetical protein